MVALVILGFYLGTEMNRTVDLVVDLLVEVREVHIRHDSAVAAPDPVLQGRLRQIVLAYQTERDELAVGIGDAVIDRASRDRGAEPTNPLAALPGVLDQAHDEFVPVV